MAETLEQLVNNVRTIQDALERKGEIATALALCKVLSGYHESSTEAIGELVRALARCQAVWETRLEPPLVQLVRRSIQDGNRMLNSK